jgi:hypothetical protein
VIGAWSGEGFKYGGVLDEFSIYNRALSDDEIETNFLSKGLAVDFAGKLTSTWGDIKTLR